MATQDGKELSLQYCKMARAKLRNAQTKQCERKKKCKETSALKVDVNTCFFLALGMQSRRDWELSILNDFGTGEKFKTVLFSLFSI